MLATVRDDQGPRCRGTDVDPEWWMDPDVYPEDFGEKHTGRGSYTLETEYGRFQQKIRTDQLRAQILCYQCPLLVTCRKNCWFEPAHVWAGLTTTERWLAIRDGRVKPYGTSRITTSPIQRRKVEMAFLGGGTPAEISATLSVSPKTVMYHLRASLARYQAQAERGHGCLPSPPMMSTLTKASYQNGLGSSGSLLADSA